MVESGPTAYGGPGMPITDATTTALVEAEPEGLYEVIGAEIREKPPMGAYEYDLANVLAEAIALIARPLGLGRVFVEMLFDLRPAVDRSRRPDVAFVSTERWPMTRRATREAAWKLVPDLAVEIVSPGNSHSDVLRKMREYFRAGVRAVWMVDPDGMEVYAYTSPTAVTIYAVGDELDGGGVVPGFRLGLRELCGEEEPAA